MKDSNTEHTTASSFGVDEVATAQNRLLQILAHKMIERLKDCDPQVSAPSKSNGTQSNE